MAENALSGLKKLPTWGKVAIVAGGGGAAYLAYRAHASSAASASSATTDDTEDPETGLTYAEDVSEYGSVEAADEAYEGGTDDTSDGADDLGDDFDSDDLDEDYADEYGIESTPATVYTTNAQWSQAVEAGLTDIDYDPADVASAVGRYLAGLTMTSDQATIVYDALAEYGNPPVGSFTVKLAPSTGTATTGTTTTTAAAPTVGGGHVVSVTNNDATIAWTGTGTSSWKCTIHGPGKINGQSNTVSTPQAVYGGLEAGHTYDVTVQPLVSGKAAGKSGTITIDTTKG